MAMSIHMRNLMSTSQRNKKLTPQQHIQENMASTTMNTMRMSWRKNQAKMTGTHFELEGQEQ